MTLTNNYVSKNIAKTDANNINTQTFTLNIGAISNCPLSFGQKIDAQTVTISSVDDQSTTQFSSDLTTALTTAATQNASMMNGLASITGGNSSDTTTNVSNTIKQTITNTIDKTNINTIAANSVNTQTMTLNILACQNSPIQANQGITSNVIAQNILSTITDNLMKSSLVASAVSNASQTSTMTNTGLDGLVASIGSAISNIVGAFTGPYQNIAIGACVLCALCCVALLYFMLSPAGQQATTTASQAGANYVGKMH